MSTQVLTDEQEAVRRDAGKLADFIMFTQRSFMLNLSKELNKGSVSFAQFFLLGYLANEDYLTMTSISKKMGHSMRMAIPLALMKLGRSIFAYVVSMPLVCRMSLLLVIW